MAVSIKQLLGNETIPSMKLIINQNLTSLAAAINSIGDIVNVDDKSLSTIKSLQLLTGTVNTPNPNTTNFTTNASANIGGHLIVGYTITATSSELSNAGASALKIQAGSLDLLSAESVINNNGGLVNKGKFVDSGISSIFRANQLANYTGGEGGVSHYEVIDNKKVGQLSVNKSSVLLLDFSTFTVNNANLNIRHLKLLTDNIQAGHRLNLIVILNEELAAYGVQILGTNIAFPNNSVGTNDSSVAIFLKHSYMSVNFIFYNNTWIYLNSYSTSDLLPKIAARDMN